MIRTQRTYHEKSHQMEFLFPQAIYKALQYLCLSSQQPYFRITESQQERTTTASQKSAAVTAT